VQTPELVLQIAIYKETRMVKTKGVLVLASQTIAEFVDAIDCTMDLALCWQDNWLGFAPNIFSFFCDDKAISCVAQLQKFICNIA
jgi:hypothetical protein